jgi:anti-anti-sigma factor
MPDAQLMTTRLMRCDGVSMLAVDGEIDMSVKAEFASALDRAVEAADREVLVDLRAVAYLDSTGCHCLVVAAEHARDRHVHLRVCQASPRAQRVLTLTGLADLLQAPAGGE